MKRTIVWPPKVIGGRLAMTEDPELDALDPGQALRQIIRLSLFDGRSTNPWNERDKLGIKDPTFAPVNGGARARLVERVRALFRNLERTRRAKLVSASFDESTASTVACRIEYTDLETGGRESMEIARA